MDLKEAIDTYLSVSRSYLLGAVAQYRVQRIKPSEGNKTVCFCQVQGVFAYSQSVGN
jgi:hypothetical protein